jgi:hypothetical protein
VVTNLMPFQKQGKSCALRVFFGIGVLSSSGILYNNSRIRELVGLESKPVCFPANRSTMLRTVCSICLEQLRSSVVAIEVCHHLFHRQCLEEWQGAASSGESPACPLCRSPIERLLEMVYSDDHFEGSMFVRFVQGAPDNPGDVLLAMGLELTNQENDCYFVRATSETSRRHLSGVTRIDLSSVNNTSYADVVGFAWFFDFQLRFDARLHIESGEVENLRYVRCLLFVLFIA